MNNSDSDNDVVARCVSTWYLALCLGLSDPSGRLNAQGRIASPYTIQWRIRVSFQLARDFRGGLSFWGGERRSLGRDGMRFGSKNGEENNESDPFDQNYKNVIILNWSFRNSILIQVISKH